MAFIWQCPEAAELTPVRAVEHPMCPVQAALHMLVLSLASTLTQYMIAYTIKLLHCTQRSFALCISAPFETKFLSGFDQFL